MLTDNKLGDVTQQIYTLKKELDDSYELFINARDMLTNLSFKSIDKIFTKEMDKITDNDIDVIISNNNFNKKTLDETIKKRIKLLKTNNTGVPELSKFFAILSNLKKAIQKMEKNQASFIDLSDKVETSIINDNNRVKAIKKKLEKEPQYMTFPKI